MKGLSCFLFIACIAIAAICCVPGDAQAAGRSGFFSRFRQQPQHHRVVRQQVVVAPLFAPLVTSPQLVIPPQQQIIVQQPPGVAVPQSIVVPQSFSSSAIIAY